MKLSPSPAHQLLLIRWYFLLGWNFLSYSSLSLVPRVVSSLMTLAVITISSSTSDVFSNFQMKPSPSSPTLTVTLHQMKLSSPPDGTFSWWTFIRWIFLHFFSSDGRLLNDFTYDDFLLLYSLVASFLMTLVTISSSTSLSYSSSDETFTPGGTSSIWAFIR